MRHFTPAALALCAAISLPFAAQVQVPEYGTAINLELAKR